MEKGKMVRKEVEEIDRKRQDDGRGKWKRGGYGKLK